MSRRINEARKRYWHKKINAWKISGKSGFAWCRENNINCKTFYTWRSRFFNQNKPASKLSLDSFVELKNKKCLSLEVEYEKFKFNLKDFDFADLHNFFKLLKSL